ncbi:MAG: hypothetical protein EOM51_09865 [Clostridia bacterium]|nr:hypothetical protein [Clostridia bacterium]
MDKADYYKNILDNIKTTDSPEVIKAITDDENCDFYELCQKYVDIALNQKLVKDETTHELFGYVSHEDIDLAAYFTRLFVRKYQIVGKNELLSMIKERYIDSISPDEIRVQEGVVNEGGTQSLPVGYFGTLIDKREIPAWEDVRTRILNLV